MAQKKLRNSDLYSLSVNKAISIRETVKKIYFSQVKKTPLPQVIIIKILTIIKHLKYLISKFHK